MSENKPETVEELAERLYYARGIGRCMELVTEWLDSHNIDPATMRPVEKELREAQAEQDTIEREYRDPEMHRKCMEAYDRGEYRTTAEIIDELKQRQPQPPPAPSDVEHANAIRHAKIVCREVEHERDQLKQQAAADRAELERVKQQLAASEARVKELESIARRCEIALNPVMSSMQSDHRTVSEVRHAMFLAQHGPTTADDAGRSG